jgi:hypothetical protein
MCTWIKSGETRIDPCIKQVVVNLRSAGAHPLGSCCGHGKYHKTIVVRTTDHRHIDYYSGVEVPRKKRFYVRDKEGVFYIPEVEALYNKFTSSNTSDEICKEKNK